LQVTTTGAPSCAWTPNYPPPGSLPDDYVKSDETLILWNYTRMAQTYGITDADALGNSLITLAEAVSGTLTLVESVTPVSQAYATWDDDYCNINRANDVARAIKDYVINPNLTGNTKYIVLVGSDEILPFYRSLDSTIIANEREFAAASQLQGGAILASMWQGFLLTDNFYGVKGQGLLGRGRSLWVADLAVGRLVEEPTDIQAIINAFLINDTISANDVLVTGYDFLTDSADLIATTAASWGITPDTLINNTWTVTDLHYAWTDHEPGRDLVSVNAHFEPWRALPAWPSTGYTSADLFYNSHITGSTYLDDSLTFSMGCHAGLNLPDDDVNPIYLDKDNNPFAVNPDFPQALAQKGACMVANTGYGYGVDDAPEYTEWLMVLFARALGSKDYMPVGEALRLAKRHYIGSAPSGGLSVYHEKVLLEATLYGLPMLKVAVPSPQSVANHAASSRFGELGAAEVSWLPVTVELTPTQHSTADGDYFSLDGEIQASPGRPIQPRTSLPINGTVGSGLSPHSIALWSASFDDIADFDPFITRPVTDVTLPEPPLNVGGWFPAKIWAVNRFGDPDRLVIVGGQFKKNEGDDRGTERLYSALELRLYYSDKDGDYLPPTIWDVWTYLVGDEPQIHVATEDESGIEAVIVTYQPTGQSGEWRSIELTDTDGDGIWTGRLPRGSAGASFFVQVVDGAGNLQVSGNKGLFFEAKPDVQGDLRLYLPVVRK
jgi:hypothetical protein